MLLEVLKRFLHITDVCNGGGSAGGVGHVFISWWRPNVPTRSKVSSTQILVGTFDLPKMKKHAQVCLCVRVCTRIAVHQPITKHTHLCLVYRLFNGFSVSIIVSYYTINKVKYSKPHDSHESVCVCV